MGTKKCYNCYIYRQQGIGVFCFQQNPAPLKGCPNWQFVSRDTSFCDLCHKEITQATGSALWKSGYVEVLVHPACKPESFIRSPYQIPGPPQIHDIAGEVVRILAGTQIVDSVYLKSYPREQIAALLAALQQQVLKSDCSTYRWTRTVRAIEQFLQR